jgi:hypothetical protein
MRNGVYSAITYIYTDWLVFSIYQDRGEGRSTSAIEHRVDSIVCDERRVP